MWKITAEYGGKKYDYTTRYGFTEQPAEQPHLFAYKSDAKERAKTLADYFTTFHTIKVEKA